GDWVNDRTHGQHFRARFLTPDHAGREIFLDAVNRGRHRPTREGVTFRFANAHRCGHRYETTRGLMYSISAAGSDSAAASSFVASFAVLLFDPHTTMPPSNNVTDAAMNPRSDRITPSSIAAKTSPPAATAIREARMNLRQLSILAPSSSTCSSRWTI